MSQYGTIYRMEFQNVEGFIIRTDIIPTDVLIPDGDTPVVIPLTGGQTPVLISTSNNARDKFEPIRSKSAQIQFVTNTAQGLDASTFSAGGDNLWKVTIYLQDTPEIIFDGFLIMADNHQPFQPDPQYVTLTATDHLAALKEIEWSDINGAVPLGKYRLSQIIAQCLGKTGISKHFFVVNNLRAGGGQNSYPVNFSGNTITLTSGDTKMFYIGGQIQITGTASNNITTIITAKTSTTITVQDALVTESATATFTDTISDVHLYDAILLDAKTFETTIDVREDCYTVLSKILGEDCFITQWKGFYYIFRVDEMEDNPTYVAEFTETGVYVDTTEQVIEARIGRTETSKFANADTDLSFIRPHNFIRETYKYNFPLEVPCNKDFQRGDFVSGTNPKIYDISCWVKRRGLPGAYNTPITITAFINREFNENGYETDRYIFITPQTGHAGFSSTDDEYIESEAIPVEFGAKFEASINFRFDSNIPSSSARLRLFRFVLHGDDGSWWILGRPADTGGSDESVYWYNTSGWTTNTARGSTPLIFGDQDETEWLSIDWNSPPMPVAGDLYIWLNQAYTNSAVPSTTVIDYANLRFEYIPLINGTYSRVTGQQFQVTRTQSGYFPNRDEEVYISDAPFKLAKGAMFLVQNGAYFICPIFFTAAPFGNSYPPNTDYLLPYGYMQGYSVWNQYKGVIDPLTGRGIGINIFTGSVKGLTDIWPDMLHKFILTDTNPQTNNRYFMLLSVEQNWKSCIWSATLAEVYNTVIFKSYDDPHELKYINE